MDTGPRYWLMLVVFCIAGLSTIALASAMEEHAVSSQQMAMASYSPSSDSPNFSTAHNRRNY